MQSRARRAKGGFSMIEVVVVAALFGVMAALSGIAINSWFGNQRAKDAARDVAGILQLARQEAIRTSTNHIVFIDSDPNGAVLQDSTGQNVPVLLVRDEDGDGLPSGADEYVASVPFERTNSVGWGSAFALPSGSEVPAPNDNPAASYPLPSGFQCCSFTTPTGNASRWVVFLPDGIPRAFSTGPWNVGAIGSGNGTVYLTSSERDYAVVLAALGGVRVHTFNEGQNGWLQ